jgi:dTDP-4-dehydrorhamnose reductase
VTDEIATPTLARDLTEATAQLVAHDAYGVYHFTNSGECSHLEWAREILRLASNLDKLV